MYFLLRMGIFQPAMLVYRKVIIYQLFLNTFPKFNIALENWWLGDDPFLLGGPILRGYVSSKEGRFFVEYIYI